MAETRKRKRTEEDDCGIQMKYYVNQQLIEQNDPELMSGVYRELFTHTLSGAWKAKLEVSYYDVTRL